MSVELQAILASLTSSLFGLAGGFLLLWRQKWVHKFSKYFVSFAAGSLLGAAFFDLLAEALAEKPQMTSEIFTWVLMGFLLFFIIEKLLLWHHHGHNHEADGQGSVLAPLIIFGDAVHNFIDGTIIAASFLVSPPLGVATALAVFFHELPAEIGDFSIMMSSGMPRRSIATWNIFGALVSPLATTITLFIAGRTTAIIIPLLGVAAGSFIYIAAADLIPEIHREKRISRTFAQLGLLILGVFTILQLAKVVPG